MSNDVAVKDEKKWCVYCHTNKENGKKYIGITSRPVEERWDNGNGYKQNQICFYRAIQKYTWDGFDHEIIVENLNEFEAKQKEIELIALYKTNCSRYYNPSYGYNMTDGGDGTVGRSPSEETRQKLRKALTGRQMSEETRKKMSKSRKGVPFSAEHRKNLSKSQIGRQQSEETRQKISNVLKGKLVGDKNPNYGSHIFSGENNPNYGKCGQLHPGYGRKHTKEELQKMHDANIGDKNPNYGKLGAANPSTILVYCKELNQIFYGAADVERIIGIAHQTIAKCCKHKRKSAGKHPETKEPLTWLYVLNQVQKDGTIIQGAISLGYVSQEDFNNFINKERN